MSLNFRAAVTHLPGAVPQSQVIKLALSRIKVVLVLSFCLGGLSHDSNAIVTLICAPHTGSRPGRPFQDEGFDASKILFATSCCADEINRDLDDQVVSNLLNKSFKLS